MQFLIIFEKRHPERKNNKLRTYSGKGTAGLCVRCRFTGKEQQAMEKRENYSSVCVILLAAGESARTETPKMLFPFEGKTLIEKVIENILSSRIKSIIVVLGAWKDEIIERIKNLPVEYTVNDEWRRGMLSSVIQGIRSIPEHVCAAIIYPADYPFIKGRLLEELTDACFESGRGIVIPVCGGKRGHPILIHRKYFTEAEKLDHKLGLRSLAEKFSNDVLEYPTDDEDIFFDIDTTEDYINATKR